MGRGFREQDDAASGVCGLNACDVGMIITDRRSTSCTHAQRLLIGGNR